jgi:hypothetical protein
MAVDPLPHPRRKHGPLPSGRRSPRRSDELPIRVFGTDYQARDFVEDSAALVVSQHGAKIRLVRKLIPEQEIRILFLGNNREAVFRVVGKASEPKSGFSFWSVECLESCQNLWEGGLPIPTSKPAPRTVPQPGPKTGPRPAPRLDSKLAWKPSTKQSSKEESPGQAVLRCPKCDMRELVDLGETRLQALQRSKGLVRDCPACGATGLWKRVGTLGS